MLLKPAPLSSDHFGFELSNDQRVGGIEESTLGHLTRGQSVRAYDDAADAGFTVVGNGHETVFVQFAEKTDLEGELQYTIFRPAPFQRLPRGVTVSNTEIHVYND